MNLGQFIKQKRKEQNLTLKQVARFVGVSEMTVSRWERNEIKNMKSDKIAALANILGIPVMALFDGWDLDGNKIETEQVTKQEFAKEVTSLLNKTDGLNEQEKALFIQTLNVICSDDK